MKEKVTMVIFILVLGSVWTTALVGVNKWTGPIIEKYMKEKLQKKVCEALVIPYEEKDIERIFGENVVSEKIGEKTIFRSKSGDVAFEIAGAGSQDKILAVMALGPNLETIKGIAIISEKETPGLGSRVLEVDNLAKFRGKKIVPRLLIVPAGTASKDNEVDAITGATLTCKALEKILNDEAQVVLSLIREEGK